MEPSEEGADAAPAQDEFDLVDSLLSKADQETDGSDADANQTDDDEADQADNAPADDDDDHLDAEDGEEDQGDDEGAEGDADDEDLDEDEEGEEDDASADLAAGRLTAKEMATIKASPELSKAYKNMQAALTVKTQDLAARRREVEAARGEVETDRAEVLDAKAVLDGFIAQLEDKKKGGGREQALIGMALDDPELFQRAYDAVAEMIEDPEKRREYEAGRKRQAEDAERDRRERDLEASERKDFGRHANRLAEAAAQRLKLDEAGRELAEEFVADAIRASIVAGTGYRIKDEAIVAAVQRAQKHVDKLRQGTRREVEAEVRVKRGKDVRKAALNGRKRIIPGAGRPPSPAAPAGRQLRNAAASSDPVSARVDELLGAVT